MATSRLPLLRRALRLHISSPPLSFQLSLHSAPPEQSQSKRSLLQFSSISSEFQSEIRKPVRISSWKPMCLYYTQDNCTMMDDSMHLEKFCHNCSVDLGESVLELKSLETQEFDYFLVIDLEASVEILEFPVLLFDAKTMNVVDVFHRFVKPTKMSKEKVKEYIVEKYGRFGVDRVWHHTSIKFDEVIKQFEIWLRKERDGNIKLWSGEGDGRLNKTAFVTSENWAFKTKLPRQCEVSGMKLPPYFMEWICLSDTYQKFYNRRSPGMLSMMRELQVPLGSHSLGIEDSKNIARVLQRLLSNGAILQITAKRIPGSPSSIRFFFQNRTIRY